MLKVTPTKLEGLFVIEPKYFGDSRGYFAETYSKERFESAVGQSVDFIQDNHSHSVKNTLRGLHYQSSPGQAKLVRCSSGVVWDVAVDIRPDSKTFGQWQGVELSGENRKQLFVPRGFAHGFCVLSDRADFQYKVSSYYNADTECTIAWNDPTIGVEWPVTTPLLSARDTDSPTWDDYLKTLP